MNHPLVQMWHECAKYLQIYKSVFSDVKLFKNYQDELMLEKQELPFGV